MRPAATRCKRSTRGGARHRVPVRSSWMLLVCRGTRNGPRCGAAIARSGASGVPDQSRDQISFQTTLPSEIAPPRSPPMTARLTVLTATHFTPLHEVSREAHKDPKKRPPPINPASPPAIEPRMIPADRSILRLSITRISGCRIAKSPMANVASSSWRTRPSNTALSTTVTRRCQPRPAARSRTTRGSADRSWASASPCPAISPIARTSRQQPGPLALGHPCLGDGQGRSSVPGAVHCG